MFRFIISLVLTAVLCACSSSKPKRSGGVTIKRDEYNQLTTMPDVNMRLKRARYGKFYRDLRAEGKHLKQTQIQSQLLGRKIPVFSNGSVTVSSSSDIEEIAVPIDGRGNIYCQLVKVGDFKSKKYFQRILSKAKKENGNEGTIVIGPEQVKLLDDGSKMASQEADYYWDEGRMRYNNLLKATVLTPPPSKHAIVKKVACIYSGPGLRKTIGFITKEIAKGIFDNDTVYANN